MHDVKRGCIDRKTKYVDGKIYERIRVRPMRHVSNRACLNDKTTLVDISKMLYHLTYDLPWTMALYWDLH